jgi:hypothetical protein
MKNVLKKYILFFRLLSTPKASIVKMLALMD